MRPEDASILVIEDDPNNLMVAVDLLAMMGVKHINSCSSGWQALKLGESLPNVNLILLDIQLPGEDGYSILKRLRSNPKLKSTRVVAMTANVLPRDQELAHEAGFDGFIGKPLDFDRFPLQIEALLRGEYVWRVWGGIG